MRQCNMQHATCNMQHAPCNTLRAACNTQHATCNTLRAACNTQHATRCAPLRPVRTACGAPVRARRLPSGDVVVRWCVCARACVCACVCACAMCVCACASVHAFACARACKRVRACVRACVGARAPLALQRTPRRTLDFEPSCGVARAEAPADAGADAAERLAADADLARESIASHLRRRDRLALRCRPPVPPGMSTLVPPLPSARPARHEYSRTPAAVRPSRPA